MTRCMMSGESKPEMKFYSTIVFLVIGFNLFGQTEGLEKANSDSLTLLLDKFVNVSFEDLDKIEGIDDFQKKYNITLDNVATCVVLPVELLTDKEFAILERRIQQLSEKFYENGTPLILSCGGMGDIEAVDRKNKMKNRFNATFISLGGSCLPDRNVEKLSKILTARTLELLKIESINSVFD